MKGFVVSQLTSTTTVRFLESPASLSDCGEMKGGIAEERYMQLTKISTPRISGKGPPLAVSSISHLRMLSL